MLSFKEGDIIELRWDNTLFSLGDKYMFICYSEKPYHLDAVALRLSDGKRTHIHTPAFWYSNGLRHVLIECL